MTGGCSPAESAWDVEPEEEIETRLLLDAIHARYGYDFREYSPATIRRRIAALVDRSGVRHVSELIPKVLHDRGWFETLLSHLCIPATEMFRDPGFFLALRNTVVPLLGTYPFIRVWHAGCSTGEEVYSSAIVLLEEGLLPRTHLFATDCNPRVVSVAARGEYPADPFRRYTESYHQAGGQRSFCKYYQASGATLRLDERLRAKVTFSTHNLAADHVFSEVNLVICRNVLIYFNRRLQDRVFSLFAESLCPGGILCLGSGETMRFSKLAGAFEPLCPEHRIYRRVS